MNEASDRRVYLSLNVKSFCYVTSAKFQSARGLIHDLTFMDNCQTY